MLADYRHGPQCLRASRALLTQVYVGAVFFCLVFGVVFSSLLGGSKTALEPNKAPTWADFGAMLGIFGQFLGVVLASQLKTALRSDFDRFLIDFDSLGKAKKIEKHFFF